MQKLGLLATRGLEGCRPLGGSNIGSGNAASASNARPAPESNPDGSFAHLKLTAEKLVKEQASVKTDLEMAHAKLKRAAEQISMLETKLQQAVNENAQLKVKQTEGSKLWQALDSKVSMTKTLCDQLTETLQQLAGQTRRAEDDRKSFEKITKKNSSILDELHSQLNNLSLKLRCAEKQIDAGKKEILELRHGKDEMEKRYEDQLSESAIMMKDKDSAIKKLEETLRESEERLQTMLSQVQDTEEIMKLKEELCTGLKADLQNMQNENNNLVLQSQNLTQEVERSSLRSKELEELLYGLKQQVIELTNENMSFLGQIAQLVSSFENYHGLVQVEKELLKRCSSSKFEKLYKQHVYCTSENRAFGLEIEELKSKIIELNKAQEYTMVQHAEECRVAEDKARRLEAEVEISVSKINELEKLATEQQEKVTQLSEAATLEENFKQGLLLKISILESAKSDLLEKIQSMSQQMSKELEDSRVEITNRDEQISLMDKKVNELQNLLDDKEKLHLSLLEREKTLTEQNLQNRESLISTEWHLAEAKKQFEVMLEGKQLELSKHLKDLSLKNDQAINDIRRKYEVEKLEIVSAEKEKAERLVNEVERRCAQKILESKADLERQVNSLKKEHFELVSKLQQDYAEKETLLLAHHKEELQQVQLHAENVMENLSSIRKEHEIEMQSMKLQHEEDCTKLQQELDLQKSKEEKQRALLQLQWKVIGERQQVVQEANSQKEYSCASIKMADQIGRKERQVSIGQETIRKDVHLPGVLETPASKTIKNVPRHRKVTHHEYEVETANGRITKRRKTQSTVMFGEPDPTKRMPTKAPVNQVITKPRKVVGGSYLHNPKIDDLFSEGSLNPYAEDPYAFG